ncbi:hypothetical protein ACHAXT_011998, partial [Thalassiosira profunda]
RRPEQATRSILFPLEAYVLLLDSDIFTKRRASALRTAALDTIPSLESILDDGRGHVNGELAQAIYEWAAVVDELAREILASLGDERMSGKGADGDEGTRKSGLSYSDLVQEGMIALLRAMSTYTNYKSHAASGSASNFEKYAQDAIRSSLLHFLAHSSRPIRLPLSLQTTLQAANVAAKKLRQSLGKEPSLVQVAKEVDIKPEQLALYRKLHRSMVSRTGTFVSVEDGMEVYDPTLAGVGVGNALHARRDSDSPGNMEGDDDESSPASMPASPSANSHSNEQDLIHLNSQEDDWERQPPERTVAPLRDALADTEEINNPLSNAHHQFLNEELDEFLRETLTEEELTVIQLRFGLVESQHGGRGWTANQIAVRMGKEHAEVVRVASAALEKLRRAASINWEEESDAFVEVSL